MNNKKQMIFCLLVFLFVATFVGLIFIPNIIMTGLILLVLLLLLIVMMMSVQQKMLSLSPLWLFLGVMVLGMVAVSGWYIRQLPKELPKDGAPNQTVATQKQDVKKEALLLFERAEVKQVLLLSLLLGLLFLVLCVVVALLQTEETTQDQPNYPVEFRKTQEVGQWEFGDDPNKPIKINGVAEKELHNQIEQLQTTLREYQYQFEKQNAQIHTLQNEYQQLEEYLNGIRAFLYESSFDEYDVYVMLSERFQKVLNAFVLADSRVLADSLLAYNRLSMYIALIKDKTYPDIFKHIKDMAFDSTILEAQFMQVNHKAVYKQICWLLFVLKYSGENSQMLLNQIKQDIEQVSDVNTQRALWQTLQSKNPKIIIRMKGDTAYVL